jgi:acetylglutamate kinase
MGTVVLKLGGRVAVEAVAQALAWRAEGHDVVVVHGAGPQITAELEGRGVSPVFVAGRRVTTPEVLDVVRASLLVVNAQVCAAVGPLALGLIGDEIGLEAEHVPELGLVGDPVPSAPVDVVTALAQGRVPVIAPLARRRGVAPGAAAGSLNVNADEAAAALAVGLRAERIAFVSDVPGVLVGDVVVACLAADEADRMLGAGRFEGGIVPKLEAAVRAVRGGVPAAIGATQVVA